MSILHLNKVSYPSSHQSFLSFISAKFPILPLIINVILHLFKRPLMNMHFSMYPITMTVCTFLCTLSQWWYALFYAPYMTLNGWPLYDISSLMACTFLCTLHDTPNCPAIGLTCGVRKHSPGLTCEFASKSRTYLRSFQMQSNPNFPRTVRLFLLSIY